MAKRFPLRKLSVKKAKVKRQYLEVCKSIDKDMMDKVGYIYCVSCQKRLTDSSGNSIYPWGHSHNLSVGQYPEFELVKANISPRCQSLGNREGCHEKLDSGNIFKMVSLSDFHTIMEVRKNLCPQAFNFLVMKMDEAKIKNDYKYL